MAKKGDILRVSIVRKANFGPDHYGIYDGDCGVFHFTGSTPFDAIIKYTTIDEFRNGGIVYKETILDKRLPSDEIIRRALSKVGSNFNGYDLINNNCEHFAFWCAIGIRTSKQTRNTNPEDDNRDIIEKLIDKSFEPLFSIAKKIDKILDLNEKYESSDPYEKDIVETLIDKSFNPLIDVGKKIDKFFKI